MKIARGCEVPGKIGVTAIAPNRLARGRDWNIMGALLHSMKLKYLPVLCGLWLAALALGAGAVSGATNLYTGDVWALVDAKKALAAASEITLSKYPDCDQATVEKRLVRVYHADGTGECQDEGFVKVLTEKGKRGNRTLSFSFMIAASRS